MPCWNLGLYSFFLSIYTLVSSLPFDAVGWLVGRQEGHPACKKTEQWGAGVVICLERGAYLHMALYKFCIVYGPADATATHCLFCFSKIQIGFTFLVPAHMGSPGKRAIKRMCVCVVVWKALVVGCRLTITMYRIFRRLKSVLILLSV